MFDNKSKVETKPPTSPITYERKRTNKVSSFVPDKLSMNSEELLGPKSVDNINIKANSNENLK